MNIAIQLLKCIIRRLLLEPVLWIYHTFCRLWLQCCGNSTSTTPEAYYNQHSSSKATYYQQGDLVVHERQHLQLCAVHTINNLLQLSADCEQLPWCCGSTVRWRTPARNLEPPCSQREMDSIACDLTRAEDELLQRRHRPWNQRCCCANSNHRTPYYGNYSFETLEVALQNRNVSLEWFQVNSMLTTAASTTAAEQPLQQRTNASPTKPTPNPLLDVPNSSDSVVVGFIINSIECADSCGGCDTLPVLRKCCEDVERHWYAISRVRRRASEYTNANGYHTSNGSNSSMPSVEAPEEERWKVIDSDRLGEATVLRDDQLRDYLQQLASQDATIFRAILKLKR